MDWASARIASSITSSNPLTPAASACQCRLTGRRHIQLCRVNPYELPCTCGRRRLMAPTKCQSVIPVHLSGSSCGRRGPPGDAFVGEHLPHGVCGLFGGHVRWGGGYTRCAGNGPSPTIGPAPGPMNAGRVALTPTSRAPTTPDLLAGAQRRTRTKVSRRRALPISDVVYVTVTSLFNG